MVSDPTHLRQNEPTVILDVDAMKSGTIGQWVEAFEFVWANPAERLDRLLALLSDNIILKAPTVPPVSRGKAESRKAFEHVLKVFPDLTGEVHRWSFSADVLFIEMSFYTTIGGHRVSWRNVDRFLFRDGMAVERIAYFDSGKLIAAYFRNFRAFYQFLKLRFS